MNSPGSIILEQPGALISFHDLTYTVEVHAPPSLKDCLVPSAARRSAATQKTILNGLSGSFLPGRVTAILGPSGGGKTSLLSLIAGHNLGGSVKGDLKINGTQVPLKYLRAVAGFVHQEDVIMDTMSVEEALRMALSLRTDSANPKEFDARIDRVLETLSLTHARNTPIGSSMVKGVSGGEKKRTAIGMELMAGPPVLLLDECTSGLDAFSAYSVMCTLKKIASKGVTVVATLHQPSSEIFEIIDDLIILVKGEILYQGAAADMVEYFARVGYQCPAYNNPPDYVFMQVINNNTPEKIKELIAHARNSSKGAVSDDIEGGAAPETENRRSLGDISLKYFPSLMSQLHYLSIRCFRNMLRNPMIIKARLMQMLILSLLLGVLYYDIENASSIRQITQNVGGSLFFLSTNLFMGGAISTMSVFSEERTVFVREYTSGYYGAFAYFISKNIVELPLQIIMPLIFCAISYVMIGFSRKFSEFIIYTCAGVLVSVTGTAYGMLIASLFENLTVALAVLPVSLLPLMLLGGLLLANDVAPKWIAWIQWISPVQYTFTAITQNYLKDREFTTTTGENFKGKNILTALGADLRLDIGWNFLLLGAILLGSQTIAFFGLQRLAIKSGGSPFLSKSDRKKIEQNKN